MDGDVAPLNTICDLADKHKAMVFVDECHSTGFFGKTGRGTEEYFSSAIFCCSINCYTSRTFKKNPFRSNWQSGFD